jgi:hypothetical protein
MISDQRELEHALREVFPEGDVSLRPRPSRGHAPVFQADVAISGEHLRLWIEFLASGSRARLLDAAELLGLERSDDATSIPVLASPYLGSSSQQFLRGAGVAFIDFAGNAWLVAPGMHVDRRGFANPLREQREGRDLFSDKASLVLRILMKERAALGVRQIAEIAGSQGDDIRLTPGYVSKVVAELERRGYASRKGEKVVLRRPEELLSDWVVSYRSRRRPYSRGYFLSAVDAESAMPRLAQAFDAEGVAYVFSGHAGASLVDRHAVFDSVEMYVKDMERAHGVLVDAGARLVDRGANVNVSVPYYRVSAFYDLQVSRESMRAASDIQLYLDLYDYPVRGREQAEHLYERRLRSWFERGDQL